MTEAPSLRDLARVIGAVMNIPMAVLRSNSRSQKLVRGRHVVALLAREAGYSYPAIGAMLRRDHSTIISSAKRAEILVGADSDFANTVTLVRRALADDTLIIVKTTTPPDQSIVVAEKYRDVFDAAQTLVTSYEESPDVPPTVPRWALNELAVAVHRYERLALRGEGQE